MSQDAAAELAEVIGQRLDGRPLLVLLDVDGTLAPIAPHPEDAAVPPETTRIVSRLAATPGVHVALVSGRAASDTARMVPARGVWILGNHGMETQAPDGTLASDPAVLPHAAAIERAAVEIGRLARETRGVIVENKRWTLSVHYRLVDERFRPAVIALARQVAEHQQLRVTEGKMVVEVRPPVEINKGTASVALARRLHALAARAAILFAGDDRTDEDAFRELRAHMPNAVTIRVGPALPPHGGSSAEFTVPSPSELQDLLAWVAHRVGAPG